MAFIGGELKICGANFQSLLGWIYIFLSNTFKGVDIGNVERIFFPFAFLFSWPCWVVNWKICLAISNPCLLKLKKKFSPFQGVDILNIVSYFFHSCSFSIFNLHLSSQHVLVLWIQVRCEVVLLPPRTYCHEPQILLGRGPDMKLHDIKLLNFHNQFTSVFTACYNRFIFFKSIL